MSKGMSVECKEKEDELFELQKELADKIKSTAETRYKISIARNELRALKVEEKADKE